MSLLAPDTEGQPTLDEKFTELHRKFPKTKKWIDWWQTSDTEKMLFPSRRAMFLDDPPTLEEMDCGLPTSTNAQELMHRLYYRLW